MRLHRHFAGKNIRTAEDARKAFFAECAQANGSRRSRPESYIRDVRVTQVVGSSRLYSFEVHYSVAARLVSGKQKIGAEGTTKEEDLLTQVPDDQAPDSA